jgi:hypothetical protein
MWRTRGQEKARSARGPTTANASLIDRNLESTTSYSHQRLSSKFSMPSDMDTTGLILLEENDLRFPHFTNEVRRLLSTQHASTNVTKIEMGVDASPDRTLIHSDNTCASDLRQLNDMLKAGELRSLSRVSPAMSFMPVRTIPFLEKKI